MTETPIPDGYVRCLEQLHEAARAWCSAHPFAELLFRTREFEAEIAREAGKPGQKPAIVAQLSDVIERWADNADTRSFLRALDAATGGEATYMQMKMLVEAQQQHRLERARGAMPAGGQWECITCARRIDGYTNLEGLIERPTAGAFTVCAYCGAIQRVSPEGTHYEPVAAEQLRRLPTSVRKQLFAARNTIEQRIREQEGRS